MRAFFAIIVSSVLLLACGETAADPDPWRSTPDAPPPFDVGQDTAVVGAICGNGTIEGEERCDDGGDNGNYGRCGTDCLSLAGHCGDGIVQTGIELCDDGALNGDYGRCDVICQGLSYRCGNGFIETDHEVCDDGDERNGTYGWCAADCQGRAAGCGDGVVTPPLESCDDGPNNGRDGFCAADCSPTPGCGDGILEAPEVCDDGERNGEYGACASDCGGLAGYCGDGVANKGHEECDDGARNGQYGRCNASCSGPGPYCGDGEVQAPEVCDDGGDNSLVGHCAHDCLAFTSTRTAQPDLSGALDDYDGTTCRDDDLLQKYMHYRLKFRGNGTSTHPGFVMVGEGEGYSIPASRRDPDANCSGYWAFGSCPRPDLADARGLYSWGDGTIWLGEYIAYLALEYAMFKQLGVPTAETLSDLRFALLAYDRVDEKAETFYPGVAPRRDGFYVRDDVPLDFHLKPGGGYRFPREDGQNGYECVSGDLLCDPPDIRDGSFTSQDQSLTLIMGFALVAHLVGPEVVVDGINLREDAREKVHRTVWFLKSHGWKVKDPAGGQPPDAWGGNAIGFSNAFAKAANVVCGSDFGVADYRDFASRTIGEAAFIGIEAIWEATHAYNRTHALRLAAVNGDWSPEKMARRSLGDGKDFYGLVAAILRNDTLPSPFSEWRVEAVLRSAPCSGPCRENATCTQTPGWMGESRTMNAGDRFGSRHWRGEFNGLDYLSLFAAHTVYKRGHRMAPRGRVELGCESHRGVMTLALSGAVDGETYDPNARCSRNDMRTEFCRRPWSNWLEDAYRGRVTIFAGGGRWECRPGEPCHIVRDGKKNTSGDDLILGTNGTDELSGGNGNDCLVGFGGNDKLEGNQGYDELWGMDGDDRLYGESSGLVLDGEADVLFGGAGNDYLEGNPGKDELYGEDGDDEMDGGAGDDFLWGGAGHDRLRGAGGDDVMHGGPGDDSLIGDEGSDSLWGGPGRDKLDGEMGDDYCHGGTGPDFVRGGMGDDVLISGDLWETNELHRDRLCGNGGDDTLWGGWDGDECLGGGWFLGGTDTVNGCDDGSATTSQCDNGAFRDW